jgi:Flp pilus assembly protein TadD
LLAKSFAKKPDRLLAMQLSQIAMSAGDQKRAVRLLSDWLAKKPADIDIRQKYALLLLQTGDRAGARNEFETVLKQRSEDPVVLNNLAWMLQEDDPTRALSLITLAAKVAPQSPNVMDTFGWIKLQRQDRQGALPLLRRAYELDETNGEIGYHFALALDAVGKRADAKTVLQSVLARNSNFNDIGNAKQLLMRW